MKKFKVSFPTAQQCKKHLKNTPPYRWYDSLEKSQKEMVMHGLLATGGAFTSLSGYFCAVSSGSFDDFGGTITTGLCLVIRNVAQAGYIWKWGNHDAATEEGRQKNRLTSSRLSFISAVGYIPQLMEGINVGLKGDTENILGGLARIATAGSAASAYAISAYRYNKAYKTRQENYEGDKWVASEFCEKAPGKLLSVRSKAQIALALQFGFSVNPIGGTILGGAAIVQDIAARIKKDIDTVHPDAKKLQMS